MNIQSISEKIPIEETIKGIEFIKYERSIEKLKFYIDDINIGISLFKDLSKQKEMK